LQTICSHPASYTTQAIRINNRKLSITSIMFVSDISLWGAAIVACIVIAAAITSAFFDMYQKPRKWETGKWLSPTALLHAMHEQCSGVSEDARNLHRLGRLLKKFDFERKRLHSHVEYKVK